MFKVILKVCNSNATTIFCQNSLVILCSFAGPLVYIIFGGTKAVTIGPTAINSILTYKYTLGKPPQYAVFLAFVTGMVCTLMSIFKLGFVANFISSPVISGFTSAVAFTIIGKGTNFIAFKLHKYFFTQLPFAFSYRYTSESPSWSAIRRGRVPPYNER